MVTIDAAMKRRLAIGGVILLALGILAGAFFAGRVLFPERSSMSIAGSIDPVLLTELQALPLINPAVTANLGKHYIINFMPLRAALKGIQDAEPHKTYIYFLYLNNSGWVGLNERDLFTAASTIKVPLAMKIYKLVEKGKLSLQDTYVLSPLDLDSNFGVLYQAGAGASFTINELVQVMLEQSDNTAAHALLHVIDLLGVGDPFADVYQAMGWQTVKFGSTPTYIDINEKTLSNMFISLYNATYLSPIDSQTILGYLDASPFDQQIVSGIASGVPVAHKIGIDQVSKTFSDCGIVFVPARPYILCVGEEGTTQAEANAFMKKVSSTAYDYVVNH